MALPNRYRWLWWTLLGLSPLAYSLGAVFLSRDQVAPYSIGRDEAVAIARGFAKSKDLSVEAWKVYVMGASNDSLQAYYRTHRGPAADQLKRFIPAKTVQVLLKHYPANGDPREIRYLETEIGSDGRILGHTLHLPPSEDRPDSGESASRQTARDAFLQRTASIPAMEFDDPAVETDKDGPTLVRTYTWKGASPQVPGANLTVRMQVRQGILTSDAVEVKIDEKAAGLGNVEVFEIILLVLTVAAWLGLGLFGLVRYIRRMRQKEVSHRRTLLIGGILGGVYVLLICMLGPDTFGIQQKDAPWWLMWVALGGGAVANVITALLLGLAWGSGEGDVREAFPGKLTSLDALMTGKIFSRNASQAVVGGTLLGGWLVLLGGIFHLAGGGNVAEARLSAVSFIPLPGLYLLLAPLERVVPLVVFGLLLPAAFAYRAFNKARWRMAFFMAGSVAVGSFVALGGEALWASLLLSASISLSLIAVFFVFDFLTAAAALNAYWIASYLIYFPIEYHVAWKALAIGGAVAVPMLLLQVFFAFRGRLCSEEEVRPLYAHHVAHRQELQAEVSAARQAQLRLGPQQVPSLPGLTVAATCRPARVVGGDFYDFFPMGQGRLGILVAEGGGEGLSAALAVAYAKGLLMPLAPTAAPLQVMIRLREALDPILSHATRLGLLYASIDLQAGSLEYARLGEYPRLLISRGQEAIDLQADQAALECGLNGAGCQVQSDDRILFFTDGIAQTISSQDGDIPEQWLHQFLASRREGSAEELLQAFLDALKSRIKRAKRLGMDDDLSSVILHLSPDSRLGRQDLRYEDEVA